MIEIKSIKIKIGDKELELSKEEAEELRTTLDVILGKREAIVLTEKYYPYPYPIPYPWYVAPPAIPYCPPMYPELPVIWCVNESV
jgi:hypothetical protein